VTKGQELCHNAVTEFLSPCHTPCYTWESINTAIYLFAKGIFNEELAAKSGQLFVKDAASRCWPPGAANCFV